MFSNNKGFDATKLKAALKLASSRFDVAKNKKSALMKQNMREIAMLLAEEPPKEEKARIRTERLIKDDYLIEAYEILQLECQLLTERVQLLKHSNKNECPADLVPCVSDLIYAAPRVEIPELQEIRKQLISKFGKTLAMDADNNKDGVISPRIVEKLSLAPPTAYMVQNYMTKIAKLHEVSYEPTVQLTLEEAFEPVAAPVGYSVPVATGTGLGAAVQQETAGQEAKMPPTNPYFKKDSVTVVEAFPCAPGSEEHRDQSQPNVSPSAPVISAAPFEVEVEAEETDAVQPKPIVPTKEFPSETEKIMDEEKIDSRDAQEESLTDESHSLPRRLIVEPASADENTANKMDLYNVMTGMSVPVIKPEQASPEEEPEIIVNPEEELIEDKDMNESYDVMDETKVEVAQIMPHELKNPISEESELELLRNRFQALAAPREDTKNLDDAKATKNMDNAKKHVVELDKSENPDSRSALIVSRNDLEQVPDHEEEPLLAAYYEEPKTEDSVDKTSMLQLDKVEGQLSTTEEKYDIAEERSKNTDEQQLDKTEEQIDHQKKNLIDDSKSQINQGEENLKTKPSSNTGAAEDHITGAAFAGGAVGAAVAGPLGGILGAAGVAHLAANKKGKAADIARKCGKKVSKMTNKLVQKLDLA